MAVTGHRPQWLDQYREERLTGLVVASVKKLKPSLVIIGIVLGRDRAVAEAAVKLEIPFIAAVPFPGQEEGWSRFNQDRYHRLLGEALRAEVIGRHDQCRERTRPAPSGRWIRDQCWSIGVDGDVARCWRAASVTTS